MLMGVHPAGCPEWTGCLATPSCSNSFSDEHRAQTIEAAHGDILRFFSCACPVLTASIELRVIANELQLVRTRRPACRVTAHRLHEKSGSVAHQVQPVIALDTDLALVPR